MKFEGFRIYKYIMCEEFRICIKFEELWISDTKSNLCLVLFVALFH